jgi:hypothetical protein
MTETKPKRKRGRPRKNPLPETQSATAVAEPPDSIEGFEPYTGTKQWLLAIKGDPEKGGALPCARVALGGVVFQEGTQRVVQIENEGVYQGLDTHRQRVTSLQLTHEQSIRVLSAMKERLVRWRKRTHETAKKTIERWGATVYCLEHRVKVRNPQTRMHEPAGYRYSQTPSDEPLAKYLVFIPFEAAEARGCRRGTIADLPTVLDLDPTMVPTRWSDTLATTVGESIEHEDW